jgi:chromosome segregation ATPase
MENKEVYELMQKMYIEMKEGFSQLNEKVDILDNKINKTNIKIENTIEPKLNALFDGYTQHTAQIETIDQKIDTIQKSVNDLTIKTLATDNKIIDLNRKIKHKKS